MSDKRFSFGVWLSVIWIALVALLLTLKLEQTLAMTPNEWGDFLAGTSAPLAFFWLVLGYLQQGEELRLNTQALELQVQELKQSVAQQQELVAVTREEMNLSKRAYEREHEEAVRQAQPLFSLSVQSFLGGWTPGTVKISASIANNGCTVRNVQFDPNYGVASPKVFSVIAREETRHFELSLPASSVQGTCLRIHFADGQGTLRHQTVWLEKNDEPVGMSFSVPKEFSSDSVKEV